VQTADQGAAPVKAQAVLIDPASMTVPWASTAEPGTPLERVVPMAEAMGVPEALRAVAQTGVAQHLQADVVSMTRKSVELVVSIYSLPDGTLLMLTERAARGAPGQRRERFAPRPAAKSVSGRRRGRSPAPAPR